MLNFASRFLSSQTRVLRTPFGTEFELTTPENRNPCRFKKSLNIKTP